MTYPPLHRSAGWALVLGIVAVLSFTGALVVDNWGSRVAGIAVGSIAFGLALLEWQRPADPDRPARPKGGKHKAVS